MLHEPTNTGGTLRIYEIIEQFRSAMREHGIETDDEIIADGKLHRINVIGDPKTIKNGWMILHADDRPVGQFGCNKRYGHTEKFTWTADTPQREFTAEEKRAYREKMEAQRAEREAERARTRASAARLAQSIWDRAQEATDDFPYLERKGVRSHGLRIGKWEKIDQETGEVRLITNRALLIPIRDGRKKIHSMQAIFASKLMGERDKDYLTDGAKEGLFYTIGKPIKHNDRLVIVIGEGYATCATIHECTGHLVVVAFDAPNLLPVARLFRERYPEAIIIMAADNDQFTLAPINNPGVTRAREAAKEANGLVAIPEFSDLSRKPTDFNDLQALEGGDAVRAAFNAILNEPPSTPEPSFDDGYDEGYQPPGDDDGSEQSDDTNGHFAILGHDRGKYYIFKRGTKQISAMTTSDFTDVGLIKIAPLNWWEATFPATGKSGGIDRKAAAEFIFRTAERRGIYDTSRIRGRGAWVDDGRAVYHHGGHLSVDGKNVDVTDIKSAYVYELAKSLPSPHDDPLTDDEGKRLLSLFSYFRWTTAGSAVLLAGWVALAPICGAVPWRPHLWLTGGASSGKSTIAKMVHNLLRGTDIFAQGSSSEAGIRQALQADALPVLMDESESNEEGDARRIQSVLALIRQSSTESDARTLKGTADGEGMSFHIRSMFCLASIQVALKHKADIDRLSVLNLRSGRNPSYDEMPWNRLRDMIYTSVERDPDVPARLLRRVIDLLPITLKNIDVFTTVCAKAFSSQRDGDQYGTLMAGAWSLISSGLATQEDAENMLMAYDWSEHMEGSDEDESSRALMALMEGKIRISGVEVTVYELICEASGKSSGILDLAHGSADAFLQRHGMRVRDGYLLISNSSNEPHKLVVGTAYASDLRGMLLRIQGADKNENKPIKFNGVQSKCIRVPLDDLLNDPRPRGAVSVDDPLF